MGNKVIFKNELYLEFIRLYISDLFPHLSLVRVSCLNYIIIRIVCSSPRFEETACVDRMCRQRFVVISTKRRQSKK